jgi:nucleosome binding factor SPN SPT16 subunit
MAKHSIYAFVYAQVQQTYRILCEVYEKCLEAMQDGMPLNGVLKAARAFLEKKHPDLLPFLLKTLGSSIGECAGPEVLPMAP